MPLHEYECDVCGLRFERIHKFSDPPLETCPQCSGHVHKLISAPAFQFKGSGWYITDYAKKDPSAASKSEGSSSSEGSSGSSSKPEGSSQDKDSTPAKADASAATSDKNKNSAPSTPSTSSAKASAKASAKDQKD
jgi:putative FmdB family regulatory protein